ncbi:MAG: 50S ribosomal protein L10 [Actinomycetia bacterium]|nr:50S ribosomal protein L10 [Actinomycetes bacterium]
MLRAEKEQIVAELTQRLRGASGLILADYRGLSVAQLEELRGELIGLGARITICKNRLTKLAAKQAGVDVIDELLTGPTAIAFVTDGDIAAVAKALQETAKRTEVLRLKGGVLDGQAVDGEAVRSLAALPPADVLKGEMVGVIVAPLRDIVSLLGAPMRELVGVLDARIRQLEEQGEGALSDAAKEPEAVEGEPAPAEDAAADGQAEAGGSAEESGSEYPDGSKRGARTDASADAGGEEQLKTSEQSEKEDEADGND